jgi:hypothetical protein
MIIYDIVKLAMDNATLVSWFHVLFVGPFLFYVGFWRPEEDIYYWILLLMGLLILGFCAYYLYLGQMRAWFYIHLLIFAVVLLRTSYRKFWGGGVIPYYLHSFLEAIGIAAFGYHGIKLLGFKPHG